MRQTIILRGNTQRQFARAKILEAPVDAVVTIADATRSNIQNAKLWAMIADIMQHSSNERPNWSAEAWKAGFMQYCGHQIQWDQGLGNCGPLPLGFRSSKLTVKEMAALIETIYVYGAERGVVWSDPAERIAA